jgi:hypothetical protein
MSHIIPGIFMLVNMHFVSVKDLQLKHVMRLRLRHTGKMRNIYWQNQWNGCMNKSVM